MEPVNKVFRAAMPKMASYINYINEATGETYSYEEIVELFNKDPAYARDLRAALKQISVVTDLILPPPLIPNLKPDVFTNKKVEEIMVQKGITTREKPIHLPGMKPTAVIGPFRKGESLKIIEQLESSEKGRSIKPELLNEDYITIDFPSPSDKSTRIPKYKPSYTVVGYDKELLTLFFDMLLEGSFGSKEITEEAMDLYNEVCGIVSTWAYNNGTIEGQLNRYAIMKEHTDKYARNYNMSQLKNYYAILQRWLPKDRDVNLPPLTSADLGTVLQGKIINEKYQTVTNTAIN
jgi:hypothetical protein